MTVLYISDDIHTLYHWSTSCISDHLYTHHGTADTMGTMDVVYRLLTLNQVRHLSSYYLW